MVLGMFLVVSKKLIGSWVGPNLRYEGNKIKVKGLDILDGTPVIDIKPYWSQYDKVEEEKIPEWVFKLEL
jgi:tRNA (Thr-GGU) A37 N-methylase